jgi:hypothetical protein
MSCIFLFAKVEELCGCFVTKSSQVRCEADALDPQVGISQVSNFGAGYSVDVEKSASCIDCPARSFIEILHLNTVDCDL